MKKLNELNMETNKVHFETTVNNETPEIDGGKSLDYNSIMQEGINLLKEQVKLSNITREYLVKVMNFTVNQKILPKNFYDYSATVTNYNLFLDKINSEITLRIWNSLYAKNEECFAEIIKSENVQESQQTSESESSMDDIEILNRSISSIDLNSPEPVNFMDWTIIESSYSPSVMLEKITVPANNNNILCDPIVPVNKKLEVSLEADNSEKKSTSLVETVKNTDEHSNMKDSGVKNVKRKATDEGTSFTNKKCFIEPEGSKEKFIVPQSYLPVVLLHRIKLPDSKSSTVKLKSEKIETEKTDNVYNLRRLSKKNDCSEIKKVRNEIPLINCGICNEIFKTKRNLKIHFQSQHVKRTFKCEKCKYASNLHKNLRRHMKIHREDSRLKTCLRSHTAKVNQSDSKSKSINLKDDTKKHKSDICNKCEKSFGSKKLLQKHRVADHNSQSNKYSCEKCKLTFLYYGRLSRHLRNVHGA